LKSFFSFLKSVFGTAETFQSEERTVLDKVDYLLQSLIEEKKVPGLSISVSQGNQIIFEKGYGFADLENKISVIPQETIFRIASISKPIAATALAILVAEGVIDLDASFYDYVPYYPKKEYDFSIRQLANHTAGIRGYRGKEYGLNELFSIKDSLVIFKDDDLLFKPGTAYQYTSYDWVLVSLAMQEASGMPFEKYVEEKVLQPLQMTNTFPEVAGVVKANTSKFYAKNRVGFRKAMSVNNFFKLAGGGYLSTTTDILKLGNAFLNNSLIPERIKDTFLIAATINGVSTYYGLGWQVSSDVMGRTYYGHIGNGVGGYSNFFVYPKEEVVVCILTNGTNPNIQEVLDRVVALFVTYCEDIH